MKPRLILASASPRRKELCERFFGAGGIEIRVPSFDESQYSGLPPGEAAYVLPAGKIMAVREQFVLPDEYVILAADTLVVLEGQAFGKPADASDAARMLRQLAGKRHTVMTGLALDVLSKGERLLLQGVETTLVTFAPLDEDQIQWYIDTGEPLDKAGAYGIQGLGAALVEQINGCYYNVMGLPVYRLLRLMQEAADHFKINHFIDSLLPWN